ncbi:MAG: response regulator [Bacteroidota bacterium]|nr:response regulator [Bacteroidota bacterium]
MSAQAILRIFIADDDDDDQMLLKEVFEEIASGIQITPMSDGKQLMKHLSSGDLPDLILLDLNMPFKNGAECLSEIRRDQQLKYIPVVILSTSKHATDIEFCYTNGAQLFFTKPCSFKDLKTLVSSILSINWKKFTTISSKATYFQIASEGYFTELPNTGTN